MRLENKNKDNTGVSLGVTNTKKLTKEKGKEFFFETLNKLRTLSRVTNALSPFVQNAVKLVHTKIALHFKTRT
jgi:hypothetical protein